MTEGASRKLALAGLVALLAGTALAYWPSLDGGFVLDDARSVTWNPELRRFDTLRVPPLREMLGTGRPLTHATLAFDLRGSLYPRRFHITGLIVHLLAVVMAFAYLRRILARVGHPRPDGVALVVAAAFALHPVQMDAVAYVSQRAEVLSSAFYLAALVLLDVAAARFPAWRGIAAWGAGVGAWVLAMGAKAIALSAPGAFVADQLVLAPSGIHGAGAAVRRGARALLIALPIAALVVWSATLQFAAFEATPTAGAGSSAFTLPGGQYFLTQLRVQWLYLRLLAWPAGLSIDRPFAASTGLDAATAAAAVGVALLVALGSWLWWRAEREARDAPAMRLAAFGIFFWFILLSPTSSVVPVLDLAVEHRVYLASLGPFLAVTVGVDAFLRRRLPESAARVAGMAVAVAVVLALGATLRFRSETWSTPAGIWREALELAPESDRILTNLAIAQRQLGDTRGAEESFRRAWAVVRQPQRIVSVAQNFGGFLIETGRPGEALAVLDRAATYAPLEPGLRSNRATALGVLNRNDEALADARSAVAVNPLNPQFRSVLGVALLGDGQVDAALAEFAAAERLDPGNPIYPVNAAMALTVVGRKDEACATYRRARATTKVMPLPRDAASRAAALGCPIPP